MDFEIGTRVLEAVCQLGLGTAALVTLRRRLDTTDKRVDKLEETDVDHERRLSTGGL